MTTEPSGAIERLNGWLAEIDPISLSAENEIRHWLNTAEGTGGGINMTQTARLLAALDAARAQILEYRAMRDHLEKRLDAARAQADEATARAERAEAERDAGLPR